MNINDKFEPIEKTDQKPTLVNLSNDSTSNSSVNSLTSSQTNLENIILAENGSKPRQKEFYQRSNSSNLYNSSYTPRRLSNIGNQSMYSSYIYEPESSPTQEKRCCLECGNFAYLTKFNDLNICDNCIQKQWQNEINELLKMKSFLENGVEDLKKYINAKKSQCNENVKSGQQIKKFISMTMQQIKRKIELELENKRDELFNSIDEFLEEQKRLSNSINEDSFQTPERVCNEIENLILDSENDLNMIKLKTIKTYTKNCIQKINQQRSNRVPIYSIFFVPDSSVQINNSFGKIVVKSFDVDSQEIKTELDDINSINQNLYNQNNEYQTNNRQQQQQQQARYNPRWSSNENVFDTMETLNGHSNRRSSNSRFSTQVMSNPKRNKSLFSRSSDLPENYDEFLLKKDQNEVDNDTNQSEETVSSKPFVPGKSLISQQSFIKPVKLTLVKNQTQVSSQEDSKLSANNASNEANISSSPSQTQNTFKQQLINNNNNNNNQQGPKLVNF